MFQITINCATAEAAITMLAKLRGADAEVVKAETTTKDAAAASPKSAEKPATPAPGKPTAAAEKPKTDAQKPKEEPSDAIPYDTVSAAISAAAKTNRDATLGVLTTFGAKNGKELKPAQYAEFLEALDKALNDLG